MAGDAEGQMARFVLWISCTNLLNLGTEAVVFVTGEVSSCLELQVVTGAVSLPRLRCIVKRALHWDIKAFEGPHVPKYSYNNLPLH